MIRQWLLLTACIGFGLQQACADTIQLKDKAAIVGKVLAEKPDQVAVDVGYTVLVMPLRANLAANSATAVGDFAGMIQALGQVSDPGHLGVIGADAGSDVGLAGCAAEQLCDALVMLSPTDPNIAQNTIIRYNPRPIYLVVGQNDSASYAIVQYLRSSARGEVGYDAVSTSDHGAALLGDDPALGDQIIQWLGKELQ